ncbi:hypothetical protein RDI58_014427 [Solanum bulbocastanum]|uniref:Uncharacterized protein n=1 Tax=Solanum bulbocastanum TaxID=147425 RepID=A0AAN8TJ02_SOLBU
MTSVTTEKEELQYDDGAKMMVFLDSVNGGSRRRWRSCSEMTEQRWRLTAAEILLAAGNGGVTAGAGKKAIK